MTGQKTGSLVQVAALALGGLASLGLAGCLESPLGSTAYFQSTATNNKTYDGVGAKNSDFSPAAQASGAHDIPCALTEVKAHWVKDHEYAAEGCGERIHYIAKQYFAVPWKMTVASREKLAPPTATAGTASVTAVAPAASSSPAAAPVMTAGCTKDVDCKGDRICLNAVCVDPPPKPIP